MSRRIFFFLVMMLCIFIGQLAFARMMESKKLTFKQQRLDKIKSRVNNLTKKLTLTEDQQKKITIILTESKEEVIKLLEDSGTKIADLRKKAEDQIEEVLTPEQRDKFRGVEEKDAEDEEVLKIFKGYGS